MTVAVILAAVVLADVVGLGVVLVAAASLIPGGVMPRHNGNTYRLTRAERRRRAKYLARCEARRDQRRDAKRRG